MPMLEKTYDAKTVEPKIAKIWEEADAFAPAPAPGRAPSPSPSSSRRRTSPARCTWAMRSTTRCRTSWSASSACAARTCCGSRAWTMPASPRRWWSSASSMEQQIHRRDLGREEFVDKVWEWKDESGGMIFNQLKRLGASVRLVARALHHGRGPVAGRARGLRHALQGRPDLQGQAAGQLGPEVRDGDLRPRGREPRSRRPHVALQVSAGRRRDLHLCREGCGRQRRVHGRARLHLDRHDAARDDAGRRRRRGASGRRALYADRRQALRDPCRPEGASPADPDHHGRISRSGLRLRRGEDHRRA